MIIVIVRGREVERMKLLECFRLLIMLYAIASCVACPIHMWRNRRERDVVCAYAWILVLELMIVLMYGMG